MLMKKKQLILYLKCRLHYKTMFTICLKTNLLMNYAFKNLLKVSYSSNFNKSIGIFGDGREDI